MKMQIKSEIRNLISKYCQESKLNETTSAKPDVYWLAAAKFAYQYLMIYFVAFDNLHAPSLDKKPILNSVCVH